MPWIGELLSEPQADYCLPSLQRAKLYWEYKVILVDLDLPDQLDIYFVHEKFSIGYSVYSRAAQFLIIRFLSQ